MALYSAVNLRPQNRSSGLIAAGLLSPVHGIIPQGEQSKSIQPVAEIAGYIGELASYIIGLVSNKKVFLLR